MDKIGFEPMNSMRTALQAVVFNQTSLLVHMDFAGLEPATGRL